MIKQPRALIAVRLSIDTDASTSTERQLAECMTYCQQRGMTVVGVAKDLDVSATRYAPWERPELSKWLDRAPEFDVIVFWRLDRFVRKVGDLHEMIKWAKEHGDKGIVSATEPFDLNSPMGEVMATMIAAFARMEAQAISERVTSMRQHLLSSERWAGGHPPYGYRTYERDGGRYLEISPEHAEVIHEARKRVLTGESLAAVCRDFTERKMPTPGALWKRPGTWGSPIWRTTNLKQVLTSQALLGWKLRSEQVPGKKYSRKVPIYNSQGEKVRVAEPILTEAEFKELESALTQPSPNTRQEDKTPFLGVLKCGGCGRNLLLHTTRKLRKDGTYWEGSRYRCLSTPGAPGCKGYSFTPEEVIHPLIRTAYADLGNYPVTRRVYVKGDDTAHRLEELEDSINQHVEYLKPGGLYATGLLRKKGEEALASLNKQYEELSALGHLAEDRWEYQELGMAFGERWLTASRERLSKEAEKTASALEWGKAQAVMAEDLLAAGVSFICHPQAKGEHGFQYPRGLQQRFAKYIKHG